ncbi:hypothetical protein [Rhodococcus artemisiae]|uniref:Secreted protein n=1 Tax=Rhodococcus artemisiae TaxID=714159 RepID=A0ABU7LI09_9NOCA|nr:hypothetical protein [Rhodococcus artemisiae]MEE2061189.1 hypothetical protein [Rhodococcus artemisiae]
MSRRASVGAVLAGGIAVAAALALPATATAAPVQCQAQGPQETVMMDEGGSSCLALSEDRGTAISTAWGAEAFANIAGDGTVGTAWAIDDSGGPDVQAGVITGDGSNVHAYAIGTPGPGPAGQDTAAYIGTSTRTDGFAFAAFGGEAVLAYGDPARCSGLAIVMTTQGSCATVR